MSATQDRKLRQAVAALEAGDHAGAERLSREILERAPRHPRALHLAAVARLGQGDGAGARELLRRVLESDPRNPQVMEDLGAAELKAGDFVQAEAWLRRAIGLGRRSAAALCWLGLALSPQGRHAEAVAVFREAAAAEPGNPGYHLNLGHELMKIDAPEEAIASYERALRLQPDYPEALNSLGAALLLCESLDAAAARFRQAIALHPDYAEAHDNLGAALLRSNRAVEAADCFRRAITLEPDNADYQADLGNALAAQELWDEAIAQYERALTLRPDYPEALNSLGAALQGRGSRDDAIAPLRQAVALRPDYADAYDNLGCTLQQLGREDEANECFQRAIALEPDKVERYFKFGNALVAQCRLDEALVQYERALALDPQNADAQSGIAGVHLFRTEFEQAWPGYGRRLETVDYRKKVRSTNAPSLILYERLPHWQGPHEAGVREVAIWAEQGIGDEVLYSTLIPELIAAEVPFLYELDQRLLGAYQRSFPGVRFVARQEPPQEALQRADRVLKAGSLPPLFRHSRGDFARQPAKLLSALPGRVAHYRQRLAAPGLKVVLSWRSTRKDWWGQKKGTLLADFAPVLKLPGVQFVDVQYGDTTAERAALEASAGVRLARFDEVDYFNDLEELLAILEACDLLITISNATAHFAGALGKRTWLLYPAERAPFHYWAHDGDHRSVWYPSVEIVSAPQLADWDSLIEHTAEKLKTEGREGGRA